jgi:hypothetical protein
MRLSESYKRKIKSLAGVISENVEFKATQGRSEPGTLSWYAEEYILNFAEDVVNSLDQEILQQNEFILQISKGETKIASNTFTTQLNIAKQDPNFKTLEFLLTIAVNFEQNSNTSASITLSGVTTKFSMTSKHSAADLTNLKQQVITAFTNAIKQKQIS